MLGCLARSGQWLPASAASRIGVGGDGVVARKPEGRRSAPPPTIVAAARRGRSLSPLPTSQQALPDDAYRRLLTLRTGLRRFQHWSEAQARAAGLTPAQHQLLLAVRGHVDPRGPKVGDVADQLLLRHHSTVGLVDRAEAAGLLRRISDDDDHRVVRLQLTPKGEDRLAALSALHIEELRRLAHQLPDLWEGLPDAEGH
jgi:DNA-binding MarR family transcriptional regulator